MITWLKYLPLLLGFRDVASAYKEEQGKEKPAFISKRFIGAVVLLVALALAKIQGVELDEITVNTLTEHLSVTAAGIYSLILMGKGIYDRIKRGDARKPQ